MRGLEQVTAAMTVTTDQMDNYLLATSKEMKILVAQTDQIDQYFGENIKEVKSVFQQIAELDKATDLKLRQGLTA